MTSSIINDLQWRYATKKFDAGKIVPKEKIEILKNAFNLTATSYGLQPIKLMVIENPTIKKELIEFSMHQKQVQEASHLLVFCVVIEIDADYVSRYFEMVEKTRGTSSTILAPFRDILIDEFNQKRDEEVFHWSKNQAYLAMGNLLTVCAVEKIDACPIEGFSPEDYDRHLNLTEQGLRSVLIMPVGYRSEDDFFSDFKKVRKPVEEIIIEIK
ncbi:NAD(P)H-dependent oxidoreductase [uncultured Planktosalinus sp.]|uniref:NAD(P)H-dependent oxidoreductase n=1 Tax=uncultured Planktosalinus sp. TaxID=1810935 RepID=UPI0030D7AFED